MITFKGKTSTSASARNGIDDSMMVVESKAGAGAMTEVDNSDANAAAKMNSK